MEARVQCLQNLLAPGEEWIALKGNLPMRGERGQTGFKQLARLLIIQSQQPGQFQNEPSGGGQIGAQLP